MIASFKGDALVSKTFCLPVELVSKMEALSASNKLPMDRLMLDCLRYALRHAESAHGTPTEP